MTIAALYTSGLCKSTAPVITAGKHKTLNTQNTTVHILAPSILTHQNIYMLEYNINIPQRSVTSRTGAQIHQGTL